MNWGWAYDGVNSSIPRNAGPECSQYLSMQRQVIECVVVTSLCVVAMRWAIQRLKPLPDPCTNPYPVRSDGHWNYYQNLNRQMDSCTENSHKHGILLTNDMTGAAGDGLTTGDCVAKPQQMRQICENGGVIGENVAAAAAAAAGATREVIKSKLTSDNYYVGKQILLVMMTFVLGLELGFKFASRTVIYVLNPCHITTIMQIYILASKPSKLTTIIFRIQMNYLNGPMLAFLFPETDSRLIPIEAAIYWVQHGLMFIIPIYLLRLNSNENHSSAYQMEALSDWTWNIISYACLLIYHFTVLTIFAIPTEVNLNHMLCPAILDPFDGPNYRLMACVHQAILCPLLCKSVCWAFSKPERIGADGSPIKSISSSYSSSSSLTCSSSESYSPTMEHPIQQLNRMASSNLEDEEKLMDSTDYTDVFGCDLGFHSDGTEIQTKKTTVLSVDANRGTSTTSNGSIPSFGSPVFGELSEKKLE